MTTFLDKYNYELFRNCIDETEIWTGDDENKITYWKGTAIIVCRNWINKREIRHKKVIPHRAQCLEVIDKERNKKIRIWNVYAPPNVGRGQTTFFETLIMEMNLHPSNTIVCGDFNMVTSPIDVKYETKFKITAAARRWKTFIEAQNYVDIYRMRHTHQKIFTTQKEHQSRRVDRIYTSEELEQSVTRFSYITNNVADHTYMILATITPTEKIRWGRGYWKLNRKHLKSKEVIENIMQFHEIHSKNKATYTKISDWWGTFKIGSSKIIKDYGIQKAKEEKLRESQWKNELERIQNDEASYERTLHLIKELKAKRNERLCFQYETLKTQDMEQGEKPTKYFFNRIQSHRTKTTITDLVDKDENALKNKDDVLSHTKRFYENLWSETQQTHERDQDILMQQLEGIGVDDDDQEGIDAPISEAEILATLRGMKNGKTPGPDGLTKEFYITFWKILKEDLTDLLNNAYILKCTNKEWHQSTTTLVYKKGCPKKLENWRPISLMNVDYKILSGILANRIKKTLPNIIHSAQKCGVPGRSIFDATKNINSAFEYAKYKNQRLIIASFDLRKAFDMVNQEYLYTVLQKLNFGKHFIGYLKHSHKHAHGQIQINGGSTEPFQIRRGLRQGCPMSMPLYVIVTDALTRKLVNNPKITGIRISKAHMKIQQYADDVSATVQDTPSLEAIFQDFQIFERATGQQINKEKTKLLCCNKETAKMVKGSLFNSLMHESITVLGHTFGKNYITETWAKRTAEIRKITESLKNRRLTWLGKALILNSLAVTKVLYNARTFYVPAKTIREINGLFFKFLWYPEKIESIGRNRLIKEKANGGIGIPHIESKIKACKLESVKIIKNLKQPTELWHWHALYETGIKMKKINPVLFTNSMPHILKTPIMWAKTIEEIDKMKWTDEDWEESSFKDLYKRIKKQYEGKNEIKTQGNDKIDWKSIMFDNKSLVKTSNKEKIINYRIAAGGYIFGDKKRRMNLLKNIGRKMELHRCKLCQDGEDTIAHVFCECKFSKKILHQIYGKCKMSLPTEDRILYHVRPGPAADLLIITKYKKKILKLKRRQDVLNENLTNKDTSTEIMIKAIATAISKKMKQHREEFEDIIKELD